MSDGSDLSKWEHLTDSSLTLTLPAPRLNGYCPAVNYQRLQVIRCFLEYRECNGFQSAYWTLSHSSPGFPSRFFSQLKIGRNALKEFARDMLPPFVISKWLSVFTLLSVCEIGNQGDVKTAQHLGEYAYRNCGLFRMAIISQSSN